MAIIHIVGLSFFLYWKFWWLDIIAHFGGGFWIGGFSLWALAYFFPRALQDRRNFFFVGFSLVVGLTVGLWWEIYEVSIRLVPVPWNEYMFDTVLDLILDAIGASVAAICFLYFWKNKLRQNV